MGSSDNLMIRWDDFASNLSDSFKELRKEKEFCDVILCCENGVDRVPAHKVILASCSSLFRRIFLMNPEANKPLLYLKGVRRNELTAVLNFMYHGEVKVAEDSLSSFLMVAEELEVKGLTDTELLPKSTAEGPDEEMDDSDDENVKQVFIASGKIMRKKLPGQGSTKRAAAVLNKKRSRPSQSGNEGGEEAEATENNDVAKKVKKEDDDDTGVKAAGEGPEDTDENDDESIDEVFHAALDHIDVEEFGIKGKLRGGKKKRDRKEMTERYKKYESARKYRPEWEAEYPWLSKSSDSNDAFCNLCQKKLRPKKASIYNHSIATIHMSHLEASTKSNIQEEELVDTVEADETEVVTESEEGKVILGSE